MPPGSQCLAAMARLQISAVQRPLATPIRQIALPVATQVRFASGKTTKKPSNKKAEKKKKLPKQFKHYDASQLPQFSICDALRYVPLNVLHHKLDCSGPDSLRPRYLRAIECGKRPLSTKYELAIRLKTMRNGPVVRDTIRLPHPISSGERFAVICPEGSDIAAQALQAGATVVGEESLFKMIRDGDMPFDRLLCHEDSEKALQQAGLGRILGPKGLMPNRKLRTVTRDVRKAMTSGSVEFRERLGVIRLIVGQLSFTPRMVADNIAALVKEVKSRCVALEDLTEKSVSEVVLSSSHGPGFNLNGKYNSTDPRVQEEDLAGVM